MLVSIITPTHERESYLPRLYNAVMAQSHVDIELLVCDDSDAPSRFATALCDERIRYIYSPRRLTQGAKRDLLVREAAGTVIAQFDDDDYYGPEYIETMLQRLGSSDLVKLSAWFILDSQRNELYYWDAERVFQHHYCIGPDESPGLVVMPAGKEGAEWLDRNLWGYGFSYVFRKRIYGDVTFDVTLNKGQDYPFLTSCRRQGLILDAFPDITGLVLHTMHGGNTSRSFPNYRLPFCFLEKFFGSSGLAYAHQLESESAAPLRKSL